MENSSGTTQPTDWYPTKSLSRGEALKEDYWDQSVQPLNCLLFVIPFLALYEIGVVWLGPSAMRNGADVWLRDFLGTLGFTEYFFLPLVTVGLLLGWHHVTKRDWKLRPEVISGMLCESFLVGLLVLVLAQMFSQRMPTSDATVALRDTAGPIQQVPHMLSFLGAGIYEELLFRLILLSGAIAFCRSIGTDKLSAITLSVVAISLLFAAAHYKLFFHAGLDFTWYSFVFRVFAGALFSVLFLCRGFGIAVGSHVVYDVLVATIA